MSYRPPTNHAPAAGATEDRTTLVRFHKDDRVAHARFGPGVVLDADGRYTLIEFDGAGVRKFITTLVQLERSDLPRPVKPAPVKRRRSAARRSEANDLTQPETTRRSRPDLPEPEESGTP